jgi:hypothetical protein
MSEQIYVIAGRWDNNSQVNFGATLNLSKAIEIQKVAKNTCPVSVAVIEVWEDDKQVAEYEEVSVQ